MNRNRKIYVLDTNMFVYNPEVVDELEDNVIVVPFWVLEELDGLKRSKPQLAYAVRRASRNLEKYRLVGLQTGKFLTDGIPTENGGLLIFDHNAIDLKELVYLDRDTVDNRVLRVAKHWQQREEKEHKTRPDSTGPRPVIVLSKDINVRIKASACEITAEDWQRDRLVKSVEDIYSGILDLELAPDQEGLLTTLYSEHSNGGIDMSSLGSTIDGIDIMPNQGVRLSWRNSPGSEPKTGLAIYKQDQQKLVPVRKPRPKDDDWKNQIRPINWEQAIAYSLLVDTSIDLVTLTGVPGTGKTLMALLAGYNLVKKGLYKRILVWRPTQVVGKDLGYYPGTLEEKFAPYARPVVRAFQKVAQDSDLESGTSHVDYDKGTIVSNLISVEPILHIKGSTEDDTFLIIDEVQDMTPKEVRAMITRAGHNTKMVLTGDVEQIDNDYLDGVSNGLTYTTTCWVDSVRSGHITLVTPERSPFVEEVVRRMK